jgi:hypothetical protein
MIEGTAKKEPKKDVCHIFCYCPKIFVSKMVFGSMNRTT